MVDFSKVINNADMVRGLNDLIHHNVSLLQCLDEHISHVADQNSLTYHQEFKSLHDRHARLLSDTIRELGGAPDCSSDATHYWIGKSKMWLGRWQRGANPSKVLLEEEEKLRKHYQTNLQALKASPESVTAIQQALDEQAQLLRLRPD